MPADLDALFEELGRQADALPLAGADLARQRGRRRNRIRLAVTAAAVVLVTVGVSVTVRHQERQAVPATPVDGRPMPEAGEPIDLGGKAVRSIVTTDREQVYAAWVSAADGSVRLTAADVERNMPAWDGERIVGQRQRLEQLVVVPSTVLVVTRESSGARPALGLFAFSPLTGEPLWRKEAAVGDSLVFTGGALVRLAGSTGRVDALDWISGVQLWSRTTGDRAVRAVGMAFPDDDVRINWSAAPQPFKDGRVVLLTDGGTVEVRDGGTGRVQRTLQGAAGSGETVVAYDGWLFTHDEKDDSPGPQRIRATDLTGDAGTSILQHLPGRLLTMNACGSGRVCVATRIEPASATAMAVTKVSAIDVRTREMAWQRDTTVGEKISSARGATLLTGLHGGLELHDATDRLAYQTQLTGGWLDQRHLLIEAPDGTGRLARLSVADGRLTVFARQYSEFTGSCASTSDRLACAGDTALRLWRVE